MLDWEMQPSPVEQGLVIQTVAGTNNTWDSNSLEEDLGGL